MHVAQKRPVTDSGDVLTLDREGRTQVSNAGAELGTKYGQGNRRRGRGRSSKEE